jgi:hypothetical protein
MTYNKLVIIITLLLIVILAVVGWQYFARQGSVGKEKDLSTDSTMPITQETTMPGTNLYRNEEWGFELEYPREWNLVENPYGSPSGKLDIGLYMQGEEFSRLVSFYIVKSQWLKLIQYGKTSDITVGGVRGTKYALKSADIPGIKIVLPLDELFLVVSVDEQNAIYLNQLLSTIRFFEAKRKVDMPGTETYINQTYGFFFQYPDDWIVRENTFYSPASKFNLVLAPQIGKSLPDPVLINIITRSFADNVAYNLQQMGAYISSISVDGVTGTRYEYKEVFDKVTIILPFNELRMIIGGNMEYKELFNQILATFKFLK